MTLLSPYRRPRNKKHKNNLMWPPREVFLYMVQNGRCLHCGKPMDALPWKMDAPNGWTRDHVVPKACGGGYRDNIVLACQACNSSRGHEALSENVAHTADVVIQAAKQMHIDYVKQYCGDRRVYNQT